MSVYSIHAASLAQVYNELGGDAPLFTWNGQEWKLLPGGAKFKRANDIGGFALTSDLQLTCLTDQFGDTVPDSGETIVYVGREYTITNLTPAPAGFQMRINADLNVQGM